MNEGHACARILRGSAIVILAGMLLTLIFSPPAQADDPTYAITVTVPDLIQRQPAAGATVYVVKAGYASVLMYGTYEYEVQEVDFADYRDKGGDRRLPVGDRMPPLPFEDLLPGRSEG